MIRVRALLIMLVPTTVLPLLAACDAPEPPRESGMTVFVAGTRSNMPTPKLFGVASEWANEAASSKDTVWVVGVSGRPEQTYREKINNACDSETACNGFKQAFRNRINTKMAEIKPTAPEADTFGAIVKAADLFGDFTGPRQIVVLDNGLQTTGELMLQAPGALAADREKVVEQVSSYPGVTKLTGVRILLSALGSRADPQPQLTLGQEGQLKELWNTLLTRVGAKVTLDSGVLQGPTAGGLPSVAVVKEDPPVVVPPTGCVRLREDQVGFKPNKAELRDRDATAKVLQPVAESLKANGGVAVTVIGTTALPDDSGPKSLSNRRAQTVIDILADLGVNRSLLTPQGVGTKFGGYINPVGPDGRFNETLAVKDRLVMIQPVGAACPQG